MTDTAKLRRDVLATERRAALARRQAQNAERNWRRLHYDYQLAEIKLKGASYRLRIAEGILPQDVPDA